jgi:hypothetical protein
VPAVIHTLSRAEALAVRMRGLMLSADRVAGESAGALGLARWFGAMQAQDLASLQWSLGLRLGGTTADVDSELERGEVVRTWPMRGTLHLVPTEDAAWMVRVFGERPLAGAAKRREYLGLSESDANRAVELLADALSGGGRLTRAQCIEVLETGGISGAGQRGYHLLWYASQHGVTCIAPNVGGEQTFVLVHEWAEGHGAASRDLSREEALAVMAMRYFQSHGPVSRKDFAGWAGITAADAKAGIAANGTALVPVLVDGVEMVAASEALAGIGDGSSTAAVGSTPRPGGWVAVAGFDEYMLGYKDRSLMLEPEHFAAVVPGGNGVFRSTLVRDGRVMATWKRVLTAKAVKVEVTPVVQLAAPDRRRAAAALQPFAEFVQRDLVVTWL